MSTTQPTHEAVTEAPTEPTAQPDGDALATIVAQTTSSVEDLPDHDVFQAACSASLETVRRHSEAV